MGTPEEIFREKCRGLWIVGTIGLAIALAFVLGAVGCEYLKSVPGNFTPLKTRILTQAVGTWAMRDNPPTEDAAAKMREGIVKARLAVSETSMDLFGLIDALAAEFPEEYQDMLGLVALELMDLIDFEGLNEDEKVILGKAHFSAMLDGLETALNRIIPGPGMALLALTMLPLILMPVVKVKGGYKIRGTVAGQRRLIGTNGGQPFRTKEEAERVSRIRESHKR